MSKPKIPPSRIVAYAAIAGIGAALDLATKSWIFGWLGFPDRQKPEYFLWNNVFSLTTSLNEGALFGFGQGFSFAFAMLSLLAVVFIAYWLFFSGAARDWMLTLTMGLITAGILGNLYDRLGLPHLNWPGSGERIYAVRDWLHFKINHVIDWPVFNLADSFLVCGAALLFCYIWKTGGRKEESAEEPVEVSRPAHSL
jgi:signal peptidase II